MPTVKLETSWQPLDSDSSRKTIYSLRYCPARRNHSRSSTARSESSSSRKGSNYDSSIRTLTISHGLRRVCVDEGYRFTERLLRVATRVQSTESRQVEKHSRIGTVTPLLS